MKIVLITDTHFGIHNDSDVYMDHYLKFYDDVFFPYLEKHNIKTIVHLGDSVDRRKYINFVTLNKMRTKFIDRLYGYQYHEIVGNHNIPYKNDNSINATNELFGAWDFVHVYDEPTTVEFDGCKILFMPWIHQNNYQECGKALKSTKATICFGHFEFAGFEMYKGQKAKQGIDPKIVKRFDMVLSGHYHHKSTKGNVTYLGTPYETTWADYNDPKGFHVFDTDTRELEFVENPYKLHHKIYYNDDKKRIATKKELEQVRNGFVRIIVEKRSDMDKFDEFVSKVEDYNPASVKIVDDDLMIDDSEPDEVKLDDTKDLIKNYVESIENEDVDKEKLEEMVLSIYNEAINL